MYPSNSNLQSNQMLDLTAEKLSSIEMQGQEILTIREFCSRLKVGRSTVFEWLKRGILQEGSDYFKVGRVLRLVWNPDIIGRLHVRAKSESDECPVRQETRRREEKIPKTAKRRSVIDFSY